MAILDPPPGLDPPPAAAVPPLENGDHLTRPEFERRYDAMPHLKKAELIEGRVYIPSPVKLRGHSRPHLVATTWIGQYCAGTPGVDAGDNGSVRLDLDSEPQPDVFLYVLPERGGPTRVSEDDYLEAGPELVVEIAASSASYDLHEKLDLYRRHGVREYVVCRVLERAVDWFVLMEGRYDRRTPGADGIYRSEVFPGLWLDPAALLSGDLAGVGKVLQEGLASPEHAEFVARLGA